MKIEQLNEELICSTLGNGLTVYVYDNPEYESMYANYAVNYGSIDTSYYVDGEKYNDPAGIAHYLEHLMFADGENDYFDYFSNLGASSNAYTSFSQTSYLFSAASNYKQNLKYLIEMVQTLNLTEERVKEEFGVINEEIEMYASKPNFILQNKLFANLSTTNYAVDIAGSAQSISMISLDDIKRLFNLFYHPSNCTLFLAGNFESDILEYLEQIQCINSNHHIIEHIREDENLKVNVESETIISKLANFKQTMFGFKLPVCTNQSQLIDFDIAYEIITLWLTSDLNPNYTNAIQSGILNESFSGYHMLDKTINSLIYRMQDADVDQVFDYCKNQIDNIDVQSIEIIKKRKIGSEIRLFSNVSQISEFNLDLILRDMDIPTYFSRLYTITSNEILDIINSSFTQSIQCDVSIMPDGGKS